VVARLGFLHNDDSLPTAAFASDAVKILIQIVALQIALSCAQYRPGGQDVATDQALRATTIASVHDELGIAARRISGSEREQLD
jgi:hypothetical protein